VEVFDTSVTYLGQIGGCASGAYSCASGDGQFCSRFGVAFDPSGNLYVVDGGNSRVQKFDSNGTYVSQFGTNGKVKSPYGIAIH
jgi:tripartite motif-containing protein 71